jgi:phosphoribosyl 1,2-cyclic phosphodiesterase
MKLIYGGIRGSFPVPDPAFMRYGGETTSVLIEGEAGERVLIDLGTGARPLGRRLGEGTARSLLVLQTHYHLDHVMGLPSLPQIYASDWHIEFAAPRREGRTIDEVLPRLMAQPFWPLQLHALDSNIVLTTLPDDGFGSPRLHGGLTIRWTDLHHDGGCSAYRIDEPATGGSLVFATDVEWPLATPGERERLHRLCREPGPASLLCFDGAFTPEQYPAYRTWGHSTWADGVEVAAATGARRLHVIHHSQYHDDAALDRIDALVRRQLPTASLAAQGAEVVLRSAE